VSLSFDDFPPAMAPRLLQTMKYDRRSLKVIRWRSSPKRFTYLAFEQLERRLALAAVPLPYGAVSWWTGNGSGEYDYDSVGGYTGTLLNGTSLVAGKVGQAFSLDGIDDLVDVVLVDFGGSYPVQGARTIEAWVFPHTNANYGLPILTWGEPGRGDFFGIAGTTGSAAVGQYELYVDHWGHQAFDSNLAVTPDTWSHVAIAYEGTSVRFYVNGVESAARQNHRTTACLTR
jgi:Concanavalin A-like lectin/glucanases superfamily